MSNTTSEDVFTALKKLFKVRSKLKFWPRVITTRSTEKPKQPLYRFKNDNQRSRQTESDVMLRSLTKCKQTNRPTRRQTDKHTVPCYVTG